MVSFASFAKINVYTHLIDSEEMVRYAGPDSAVSADEDFSGYVKINHHTCDNSESFKIAAWAAAAAYEDSSRVGIFSTPVRNQKGNTAREKLVGDGYQIIGFSANVQGYGNLPAGVVACREEANGRLGVIVAFSGTQCLADTITDLNGFKTSNSELGIEGCVHSGINNRYMQSRESLFDIIHTILEIHDKKPEETDLLTTGHSLGGALCKMAAFDLKSSQPGLAIKTITFNDPRLGDQKFAHQMTNTLGAENIWRVYRTLDPVPAMAPFWLGFKHVGTPVKLESKSWFPPFNHGHSLNIADVESEKEAKTGKHENWREWFIRNTGEIRNKSSKTIRAISWLGRKISSFLAR